jgi:hypothetical protein
MERVLETLTFGVFEFELEAVDRIVFPEFKGNVFRGAMGNALRKLTCALRGGECGQCLVRDRCVYARIFESHNTNGESILKNIEKAPHPFIIYIPDHQRFEYQAGEPFVFHLTLVGNAIEFLSYFILAFEYIGANGIGHERGTFKVKRVTVGGSDVYDPAAKKVNQNFRVMTGGDFAVTGNETSHSPLQITFVTPLRLRSDGKFQKHITFEMLIRSLLRRLYLLSAHYCGGPNQVDFSHLANQAATITISHSRISWRQQMRFSHRQQRSISMGGVTGRLQFTGHITPFIPYLQLAQHLHIGSGTGLGLGKIKL